MFQDHAGHLASTYIPEDMELINKAIPGSRPDGKQLVPIWIKTEENMVFFFSRNFVNLGVMIV